MMNDIDMQGTLPWQSISKEHIRMQVGGSDVLAITLSLI